MEKPFSRGDRIKALVGGKHRELEIDHVSSDSRLAQCHWMDGASRRHVTVLLELPRNPRLARLGDKDGKPGRE